VLIRINSCDDARIDIYFFHPLVGGAFYPYRSLIDALHFDASVNIYGIQHPNTFDDAVDSIGNIQTIEQLVAYYLSSIVFASDRPYLLIGASLGAILAYEAEVQLQMRAGRCATGILIIDSVLPTTDNTITKSEHTIQMRQILESYGSELHDSTLINAMINNAWHLLQMAGRYRAHTSINARVCVLRVVDSISDYDSWQRYCRQPVTIHHIAGTHSNMLNEKHAQLLAIQIKTICAQQFDLCL
jgi:thioesterase domain-containing protein